jgi:hypothetical protein
VVGSGLLADLRNIKDLFGGPWGTALDVLASLAVILVALVRQMPLIIQPE